MNRFIKKIRLELFFIYKLFNPKYTPVCAGNFKCYLNYFKNKFFWKNYIKNIPKFSYENTDDLEIHLLVQKTDIWPLIWTLTSFLFYSGLKPKIIIHDDGSLDAKSIEILASKFSYLEVISRSVADKILNAGIRTDKGVSYRKQGHPLILKLIDIIFMGKASNIMVLDSDILFFKEPAEIIEFVRGKLDLDALISCAPDSPNKFKILVEKNYIDKYDLIRRNTELMNSGIVLYRRSAISESMLYEYFENCLLNFNDYFVEMTGWNCLIAQTKFRFLPVDKYIIKGKISDTTVAKHFTSGRRQELYAYGIDKVKGLINANV